MLARILEVNTIRSRKLEKSLRNKYLSNYQLVAHALQYAIQFKGFWGCCRWVKNVQLRISRHDI